MPHPIYDAAVETLAGQPTTLAEHRDKVLLVVNTASKCGFTPQYAGLEALHARYADAGLVILGFPCNQFGQQEPGAADEIATFCQRNYGVSFPMFAKVDVNGAGAHPLFTHLKREGRGLLGSERVKWNFTKWLIGRDGQVITRFASATRPDSKNVVSAIESALSS